MCAITRMEILCSARSPADFATLQEDPEAYRDLRIGHATMAAAEAAQRELVGGRHRVALPDLVIGACAQQHAAAVHAASTARCCPRLRPRQVNS
jgi:predicted nucleic acid-binding protein